MPRKPTLNPRKQATQARAAETVAVILEGAAHILEERGLEGYTTNAIAERAGVSIGSLYQYFPNKDAVTIALIGRESAGLLADIEAAARLSDWQAALRAMVEAGVAHQLRRPRLARLLDIEESRLPDPSRDRSIAEIIFPALVSVLEEAPLDPADDPAVIAFDIMAITRGMTDMAGARGETEPAALSRRVLRAVSGYLTAGPTASISCDG